MCCYLYSTGGLPTITCNFLCWELYTLIRISLVRYECANRQRASLPSPSSGRRGRSICKRGYGILPSIVETGKSCKRSMAAHINSIGANWSRGAECTVLSRDDHKVACTRNRAFVTSEMYTHAEMPATGIGKHTDSGSILILRNYNYWVLNWNFSVQALSKATKFTAST